MDNQDNFVKIDKKYYCLVAGLIGMFSMYILLSIVQVLWGSKYCILEGDLVEIYVPAIKSFYRSILSGESIYYSWSNFLGMNTSAYYAFSAYSLTNLLFLLPDSVDVALIVCIIIVVKTGLCACTFTLFAQKVLKVEGLESILFSVFYSMCAFQVSYNITNIIWIDGLFMLPIIICLIKLAVDNQKCILLILGYAYLFLSNFYLGYMIGFFSALFFLIYLFGYTTVSKRSAIIVILKYTGCVILAAGLGAFALLPAAAFLFTKQANDANEYAQSFINLFDIYNQLFIGENNGIEGVMPYIYCGILSVLLVPVYFVNEEIEVKEKVVSASLIILLAGSCLIKPLHLFWHVGDMPDSWNFRFAFLLCFVLCSIACRQFIFLNKIKNRYFIIVIMINAIIYYGVMLYQSRNYGSYSSNTFVFWMINIIFFVGWFVLMYFLKKNESKKPDYLSMMILCMIVAILEVEVNGYTAFYKRLDTSPSLKQENYLCWEKSEKEMMNILESDSEFYRVKYIYDLNHNSDTLYGYNGVSDFSTMENYEVRKVMEALGVYTSTKMIYPYGFTPFTDMLFDVKYNVVGNNPNEPSYEKSLEVNENARVLGLGFLVNDGLKDFSFRGRNPYQNSNELISAMTGEKMEIYSIYDLKDVNIVEAGISLQQMDGRQVLFGDDSVTGLKAIQYTIPIENRQAFASFDCGESEYILGCPVFYEGIENAIYTNGLFGVLYAKEMIPFGDNYTITICMDDSTYQAVGYNDAYFAYFNDTELQRAYDILRNGQMDIEKYNNGYVKARVNCNDDNTFLMTTIPYDSGWKVYVNGEIKDYVAILDGAFIGIKLENGINEIEFKYHAPAAKCGITISVISVLIFGILLIRTKRRNKK